jgi:hypothetical protein
VIRTLEIAATLAGAIVLAPVAQAQPNSSTDPDFCNSVANRAALPCGPNKFVPMTTATPFGSTIARQPGLATATTNGNIVVPTGMAPGYATPMAQGNMVGPATTTTPVSGGIRTRHGKAGGLALFGILGPPVG